MLLRTLENQDPEAAALNDAWPYLIDMAAGRSHACPPAAQDCALWTLYAPIAEAKSIVIGA